MVYLRKWRATGSAHARRQAYQQLRGLAYFQTLTGDHAGEFLLWMQPDGTLNPTPTPPDNPNPADAGESYWTARAIWAFGEGYASFARREPAFAAFLRRRIELAVAAIERDTLARYGDNHDLLELVERLGLPAVAVNCAGPAGVASVDQQHQPGLWAMLHHLIHLGHTRIAHVSGPAGFVHSAERQATWYDTLIAAGLTPGPLVAGDFTSEGGVRAADHLLGLAEPPTAVVCANDLTAIGFISRASALGFAVPRELSVTGFDGIQLSGFTAPPLTTVQTSPPDLGAEAARLLLHLIGTGEALHSQIAAAELLVRGSTAAPLSVPASASITVSPSRTPMVADARASRASSGSASSTCMVCGAANRWWPAPVRPSPGRCPPAPRPCSCSRCWPCSTARTPRCGSPPVTAAWAGCGSVRSEPRATRRRRCGSPRWRWTLRRRPGRPWWRRSRVARPPSTPCW